MNDHAAMAIERDKHKNKGKHRDKRRLQRDGSLPNRLRGDRSDSFPASSRDAWAVDRFGSLEETGFQETVLRETNCPPGSPAGSHTGCEELGTRLNKFLAQSGLCSRRKADELVKAGRVTLNGNIAKAGDRVLPFDEVAVDGRPLGTREETVCLMLNKPPKVVSTASDPEGRATVLDFVPKEYRHLRLYPVGRLDYLSEGLILLTNDGDLAQRLAHPSNNQRKVYDVEVRGSVTRETLAVLGGGMTLSEGDFAAPCEVTAPDPGARTSMAGRKGCGTTLLRFVLHQGLNRQIRRMCRDAGLSVRRLRRVAEGQLELGTLAPGKTRVLGEKELELLREDD